MQQIGNFDIRLALGFVSGCKRVFRVFDYFEHPIRQQIPNPAAGRYKWQPANGSIGLFTLEALAC